MSKVQYWEGRHMVQNGGFSLEARANLAWNLLMRWGLVVAEPNGQDDAGRAIITVMPPQDTVDRAFALADAFMDTAESRGEVREVDEGGIRDSFRFAGELERERNEAVWPRREERTRRAVDEAAEPTPA